MGDEMSQSEPKSTEIRASPRRLRNHSMKEATSNPVKMSAKLPELEEDDDFHLISKDDFSKKSSAQKLDTVADAINKLYEKMNQVTSSVEEKIKPMENIVLDGEEGIIPKVSHLIENARMVDSRFVTLMEENVQLRDEVEILKGVVHKLSRQLDNTNTKVHNLVAKSMEDNLVFTGILDDIPKRNPRRQLHRFLRDVMNLQDVHDDDIFSVYRMGQSIPQRNRPIVAHCSPEFRRYIMNHAPILKDKLNEQGMKFYINPQLPEAISELRRENRQIIKDQKEKEHNIPPASKSKFVVRNDKLFINGQLKRKKIVPPAVQQLFPNEKEQKIISAQKLRFFHTPPESGSKFKVGIQKADSFDKVNAAYTQLFQKYPSADHIAVACLIGGQGEYHDNGEFGAGFRMLKSIKQSGADNVAVFMIRYFGGVNLGPRRFTIMTDLVSAALDKVINNTLSPETSPKQNRERHSSGSSSSSTAPSTQSQIEEDGQLEESQEE